MKDGRPPENRDTGTWNHREWKEAGWENGWKAGRMICIEGHFIDGTRPCLKVYTKGRIRCQCQDRHLKLEWSGFMPWYDEIGKPKFSVIREHTFPVVDAILDFAPLKLGKNKAKNIAKQPVWVKGQTGGPRMPFDHLRKRGPANIMHFLKLTLWKLDDVTLNIMAQIDAGELDQVQPVTPKNPAREDTLPTIMARHLIEKAGGAQPAALAGDAVDALVNRLAGGSRNGKHTVPPKG